LAQFGVPFPPKSGGPGAHFSCSVALADGVGIETKAQGGDAVTFSALAASQPFLTPEWSVIRFWLLPVKTDRRRMPLKPSDGAARTNCSALVVQ
jgi:hypothetical protein